MTILHRLIARVFPSRCYARPKFATPNPEQSNQPMFLSKGNNVKLTIAQIEEKIQQLKKAARDKNARPMDRAEAYNELRRLSKAYVGRKESAGGK